MFLDTIGVVLNYINNNSATADPTATVDVCPEDCEEDCAEETLIVTLLLIASDDLYIKTSLTERKLIPY